MAGVQITIEDHGIQEALEAMMAAAGDLRPAHREIGEHLDVSHRQRWDRQVAPDGTPWAPLAEATRQRKARKGKSLDILVEGGDLRGLLRYRATAEDLAFGTDRKYSAVQHFGAKAGQFGQTSAGRPIPWGDIPARPHIGVSDEDRGVIMDIMERHLARRRRGR